MKRKEEEEETVEDKGQVEDQVELLASSINYRLNYPSKLLPS